MEMQKCKARITVEFIDMPEAETFSVVVDDLAMSQHRGANLVDGILVVEKTATLEIKAMLAIGGE